MISKSKKEQYKNTPVEILIDDFLDACDRNNVELVHYLLTDEDLEENVNIHIFNEAGLRIASSFNNLETIKYLLTSPDLKEHASINKEDDKGLGNALSIACERGHVETVKYLLTSPDLKEKANLHYKCNNPLFIGDVYNYPFLLACINKHLNVVEYLIFEHGIEFNEQINKSFKLLHKDIELMEIMKLFDMKKLKDALTLDLVSQNNKVIKVKI